MYGKWRVSYYQTVNVIVKTEAPLLAACNPDDGIYDPKETLASR